MPESVLYDTHCHVARITLNRPEKGNAVNIENLTALKGLLDQAIADQDIRAVVIEGSSGVFCRGLDFEYLLGHSHGPIDESFSAPYLGVVLTIRNSPKPVIAAVDGEVLAGGMGIALACDIVLATEVSRFGLSEVLFGLIPAYVFPFLLERVPHKKARYLVLSSRKLDASEALRHGVIDEMCPEGKLERCLTDTLRRLLYSSPRALQITKTYSDAIQGMSMEKAGAMAAAQLTELLNDQSNVDAIKSFLDGEAMPWTARYRKPKTKSPVGE